MTEEIIIDGVNVAGCEAFFKTNKTCYNCYACEGSDCYFKQLQRAEIEIEKLKGVDGNVHPDSAYYKITRLEQENKELKKQIESQKGLITVGGKQQYKYLQEIDKLQQENKEIYENGQIEITKLCNEKTKYRSALEEIRGIVTSTFAKQRPYKEDFAEIETKINEVLKK